MRSILLAAALLVPLVAGCGNTTTSHENNLAPFTETGGGPQVSGDAACDLYLACVLQTTPSAYVEALTAYGEDSVCWKSAGATAGCEQACTQATASLKRGFQTDCCRSSADCGGGACDTKTGACTCTSDLQCDVGRCDPVKRRCDRSVQAVLYCAMGQSSTGGASGVACLGKSGCCNIESCGQLDDLQACAKLQCAGLAGSSLTYCVQDYCYSALSQAYSSASEQCE